MAESQRFYLKGDWETEWREVTREQFIQAERNAGFYPKTGDIATGGFGGRGVSGKIEYGKG